jgi:hypothetical protein
MAIIPMSLFQELLHTLFFVKRSALYRLEMVNLIYFLSHLYLF